MDFFGYDAIFKKKIKKSYKFIEKKYKLTKNELIIISYLAENSESNLSSDIVKNLGFSKSHVSLSVANLIKSGYLNTISNKQDKKKMHLVLKDKASEIRLNLHINKFLIYISILCNDCTKFTACFCLYCQSPQQFVHILLIIMHKQMPMKIEPLLSNI